MRKIVVLVLVLSIYGCQAMTNAPSSSAPKQSPEYHTLVAAYLLTVANDGLSRSVDFYHPAMLATFREILEISLASSAKSASSEKALRIVFDAKSDKDVARMMLSQNKRQMVKIQSVAIIHEFEHNDIKYIAAKIIPINGQGISPYIQLVPIKLYEDQYYIYDQALSESILNAIKNKARNDLTKGSN